LCGGGNLNDNSAMSSVMRALKRLANKFGCAILILHHTRKGNDFSTADAIGGASAIVNLARRALMAAPMTAEEAPRLGVLPSERSSYLKTVASKSNLSPRSDDAPWYQLCSVTLPNAEPPIYMSGDRVQAVARVQLPRISMASPDDQKIRRAILDTVDLGKFIDGQAVQYSPNMTGARNVRALIDDAVAAVKAATAPHQWHAADLRAVVVRSIGALQCDGSLVEEVVTNNPRFRRGRGLRVDWSRTPWANKRPDPSPSDEPVMNDAAAVGAE
jgi:hypothetical protein